jgi:hypothetical protein
MHAHADGGKRCPPSLTIVMRLEATPRIYSDCVDDWESSRMLDWIGSHPELAELLDRAIEIAERWERAA